MEDKDPDSDPFEFTNAEGIAEFCKFALTEHKPSDKKKPTMAFHWRTYSDGTNNDCFFLSYNILYIFAHRLNDLDTIPEKLSATWVSGEVIEIIDDEEDGVVVSD
ncbi:hypothetical protein B0H14DRAFT_3428724 [Mycena olivaceomarginata]|nr:hypothetical protein B0H14DRAFT_3428724 [Mycena olivaceomarginata]